MTSLEKVTDKKENINSNQEIIPKTLQNLIDSYENEEKYKSNINNKKLLLQELEDIDIGYMLNCKIAIDLAKKYILKYEIKNAHPNSIAGIFVSLLEKYSSEEILDAKNVKFEHRYFNDFQEASNLYEYIEFLISNFSYQKFPRYDFCPQFYPDDKDINYYKKIIKDNLNEENFDFFRETYKNDYDFVKKLMNIIEICFHELCKNGDCYDTICWTRYKKEINSSVAEYLKLKLKK